MNCRFGEWECPYVEETNGQCCIPEKCPEWQGYNEMSDALYDFTLKEYLTWIDVDNKIGEACKEALKDEEALPVGKICYLDFEK